MLGQCPTFNIGILTSKLGYWHRINIEIWTLL